MRKESASYRRTCSILVIIFFVSITFETAVGGVIRGVITQADTNEPLEDAVIRIKDSDKFWSVSDEKGEFLITGIHEGENAVIAQMTGYHDSFRKVALAGVQDTVNIDFKMIIKYEKLPEIIVTPGHYEVLKKQTVTIHSANREEIKSIAGLGEDFYRSLIRFPGITANDFSARFNIRGGGNEEVLALLDGQELYEPFHLKNFGGALSILDMEAIGGVDLITGGFPVEYGNRLSGVLDMKSYRPSPGENRTMFGISFTSARFLTEGTFAEGKGNWMVSLRRGYLDIILNWLNFYSPGNTIRYYDGFARMGYTLNKNHSFLFNVLQAGDYTEFVDDDEPKDIGQSGYGNTYVWGTWQYTPSENVLVKTIGSLGRLAQEREGTRYFDFATPKNPLVEDYVSDDRTFVFAGLKQDWSLNVSQNHFFRTGYDIKAERAVYDYFVSQGDWKYVTDRFYTAFDTSDVDIEPDGYEAAWYLSDQWHIGGPLTVDIGIRFDRYSYLQTNRWSPRASMSLALREKTVLRTACGLYHQAPVIDGMPLHEPFWDNPRYGKFDPPVKATHYIIGIDHGLPHSLHFRMEGYYKKLEDVWPRFESLNQDIEVFPETLDDRTVFFPAEGTSRGIELFLKRPFIGKWGFWFNYIWSHVTDCIDGRDVPRTYDQRHQFSGDVNFRPNSKWNFHIGLQFHTGRPQTPVTYEIKYYTPTSGRIEKEYGDIFSIRLPHYNRVDLKIIRRWNFHRYTLVDFLEIINLFGRSNVRRWAYRYRYHGNSNVETNRRQDKWFPFVPSVGIALEL